MSFQKDRQILHFKDLQIEYLLLGKGKKLLLCFPGFGRPAEDYKVFESGLGQEFTMCCINQFFHFNSKAPHRDPLHSPLKTDELTELVLNLTTRLGYERFSLMGYSLGGRICLTIAQLVPTNIQELILLAPDGIIKGRWYVFTTHTWIGRWLYRRFMNNNELFFKLLSLLRKKGLISQKIHDFVRNNTATKERQRLVYEVWLFLRRIEPDLRKLGQKLTKTSPPVLACFGKYDKIILPINGERLKKHLPWAKAKVLNAGHRLMTYNTARILEEER